MQLFGASAESSHLLLVSIDVDSIVIIILPHDNQTPFLNENNIVEEETTSAIQGEKTDDVKQKLITHFKLTKEELAIYPFNDLIQMGVSMKNV